MDYNNRPPEWNMAEAEWLLACKGRRQFSERIKPGLYKIYWVSGGFSLAAIGCGYNGDNWIAPINWTITSTIPAIEGDEWGSVDRVELIEVIQSSDDEDRANA